MEVDPSDRSVVEGPQLDKVRDLIDEPQPKAPLLISNWFLTARQWLVDPSAIAHLTDDIVPLAPHLQHTTAAAMSDAIGCKLVYDKHQILYPPGAHALSSCIHVDEPANRFQ